MEAVFERKKRLLPRPTDLSFYNWDTQMATSNATANFQVKLSSVVRKSVGQCTRDFLTCCRLELFDFIKSKTSMFLTFHARDSTSAEVRHISIASASVICACV